MIFSKGVPTEKKENFRSNLLPTYILSFGINIFFFLLLFIPSMTKYWSIVLLGVDLFYLLLIKDNIRKSFHLNINYFMVYWIGFALISFGSLSFTGEGLFEGIKFIFTLSLFLFNFLLLTSNNKWIEISIKMLLLTSLFFLFGSIIQLIYPSIVLSFNRLHLSEVLFEISLEFYRNGSLNGFTYQTAVNGFILSVLMGINVSFFYKVEKKSNKIYLGIIYLFLFYLLVLTQKRGFILINLIILFFLIYRLSNNKKVAFYYLLLFSIVMTIMILSTESGINIIERTFSQEDFSTGRSDMIRIMWNDFLKKPLLGHGTYTTIDVVRFHHGHNIYFQVLRETGIFGFLAFLFALILGVLRTNNNISKFSNNNQKQYMLIFSLYVQLLFILWGAMGNPLYDTYPLFLYFFAIAISESLESAAHSVNDLNYVPYNNL